ncbi:hypothetical protein BJX61DRAFT_547544 [Aspergillus egyptiacus]|nr:hypothetical protein BJX61DRAFT_547544 [Aspergillus egyptiacus]
MSTFPEDASNSSSPIVIDMIFSLSGNLAGARETVVADWTVRDHYDYAFGATQHQIRCVRGRPDEEGKMYPDFEIQSQIKDERARKFLRGEVLQDGSRSEWCVSDGKDVWVHTFARSVRAGWTAEHIWGFEVIDGTRYHTRRVVASNEKGQWAAARAVYRFVPRD